MNTKLSIAYKVVRVNRWGQMWSVNTSGCTARDTLTQKHPNDKNVIVPEYETNPLLRYRLRHVTYPAPNGMQWLYICSDKANARKALEFYSRANFISELKDQHLLDTRILRGYGMNVRPHTLDDPAVIAHDEWNNDKHYVSYVPNDFVTYVCDWFIPVGIIRQ